MHFIPSPRLECRRYAPYNQMENTWMEAEEAFMSDFNYREWYDQSMKEFWQRLEAQMERDRDKYPLCPTIDVASKWPFAALLASFICAFGACAFYSSVSTRYSLGILGIALLLAGGAMIYACHSKGRLVEKDIPSTLIWGILAAALMLFSAATAAVAFAGNVAVLILIGILCICSVVAWGRWFSATLIAHGMQ